VTRGFGAFLRDNIEAFAVAIAMALVIRHYCLEAFRIPTGSMKPTLYGDNPLQNLQGDRILVDKAVYQQRDPRRFEVFVFQYPLNRNKNFIKRVGGLPNEWLRLVDGDIWVSKDEGETWTIQRKPKGARNELLFPYYPTPVGDPLAFRKSRNWDPGPRWTVVEKEARLDVNADDVEDTVRFRPRVLPYDDADRTVDRDRDPDGPYVGDVRIRFQLEVARLGTLVIALEKHGETSRLVLGPDESHLEVGAEDGKRIPLPFRLEEGATHDVAFTTVDNTLIAEFDGDEIEHPFRTSDERPPLSSDYGPGWMHHSISLAATRLQASLRDVHIDRDEYYNARAMRGLIPGHDVDRVFEWRIPPGHFFALGDNTQSSNDSRAWKVNSVELRDGTVIEWVDDEDVRNPAGRPPLGGDEAVVVVEADVDGIRRTFRAGDVAEWHDEEYRPFISRDHLIGRAFAVFWPIYVPRLYAGPTRVKLIR